MAITQAKYPAKAHARRVAEKLKEREGIILLAGARQTCYPDSKTKIPFRQDRSFYYLSGCALHDVAIIYDIARDTLTLLLPSPDRAKVAYDGAGVGTEKALHAYDIDDAQYVDANVDQNSWGFVTKMWPSTEQVFVLPGLRLPGYSANRVVSSHLDCAIIDGRRVDSQRLKTAVDACRMVKDEYEIGLMRRANDIASAAHVKVMEALPMATNEAQLESVFVQHCIAAHAKEQPYGPIVASGANGAIFHYRDNRADFNHSQTLVVDAGCEVDGYASDITRTLVLNPVSPGEWPSRECRLIYEAVQRIQEACIEQLAPGKKYQDIAWSAQHMAIDTLLELGILVGDKQSILRSEVSEAVFHFGLGHFLGLDVHDVSTIPLRGRAPTWPLDADTAANFQILEAGMVVTVEPGFYFNEVLLEEFYLNDAKYMCFFDTSVLKKFLPVGGIRIEDDILVTSQGYENLTNVPKGEAMLKYIRSSAESLAKA